MDYLERSLELHARARGKLEITSKVPLADKIDLSLAYTPGVAAPCLAISKDPARVYDYTAKGSMVAVVTDGTAVLGLGDIGPAAALPVMEGKAILFKEFGGINAFPIALDTRDPDEIVRAVTLIAPGFGGINLEDISAPRCFAIENRLKETLDIPVFHDDQHGTAVVVLAGLLNALKVSGRRMEELRVVISGAGAAGIAVAKILLAVGVSNVILCDRRGPIYDGRANQGERNFAKEEIARFTNRAKIAGGVADALAGADVFIGLSAPGVVTPEMVRAMAPRPIIFALANPVPEITPDEARSAGAAVIATGRSDYPNQVNNLLAFPGIFKGALSVRARAITEEMKLAAARAIAGIVPAGDLSADCIIPSPLNRRVADEVAAAVASVARGG